MSSVQTFNNPLTVGEYGLKSFLWDAGIDLTAQTDLTLKLRKPDGTEVTFTGSSSPPVTLGTSNLFDQDGNPHGANQYVTKQLADGDLDQEGNYQLVFMYTTASGVLKTRPAHFWVAPEFD